MGQEKILLTGANGQLGTVLTSLLKEKFGDDSVIATDLYAKQNPKGIFEQLDATNLEAMTNIVKKYGITQIYHLAAILSAKGEDNPLGTWEINLKTLHNVLEVAVKSKVSKVFFPSSIAVFGVSAPKENTPQDAFLDPTTVYGISKAAGENWAQYYFLKYGLDVRSLRYPGVIGHQSLPGGGTTDYAVEIYHKAINKESFECYLSENTKLPMIFMDDAVRATIELMDAPKEQIKIRTSYNLEGVSFSPKQIATSIRKSYPDFQITYAPDFRQEIANNWPSSIDDTAARKDWGWKPNYLLDDISEEMITQLKKQYSITE
ncbi:MAG: NAD-dependent epimerase/dehydratase family protein [Cellulophaga sp.]